VYSVVVAIYVRISAVDMQRKCPIIMNIMLTLGNGMLKLWVSHTMLYSTAGIVHILDTL